MNPIREKAILAMSGLVIGSLIGYSMGFYVTKPKKFIEKPLPEIRQKDTSLVLERQPDTKVKPKQAVPKGDKVERIISVEVKTDKLVDKVKVDLTVVSDPSGGKRVIASSPDGVVTGGIDIPVATITIPKPTPWSAGIVYSPVKRQYGGFISYRKGAFIAQTVVLGDNILVGVGINF